MLHDPNDSIVWSISKWYTIEFCQQFLILEKIEYTIVLVGTRPHDNHHEGEVEGVSEEEEEEGPWMLWVSLPEVPKEVASLRETEEPSAGSFFIGMRGGVREGGEWEQPQDDPSAAAPSLRSSSSPEETLLSKPEGEVSGVSNGVFTLLALSSNSFS